jgi:transketolase
MRNAFMDAIIAACQEREDIFVVSGDAGLGVFDEFKQVRPDRFLNLGVAEQNTISFAAGLSMTGHKVIVYNIIPFLLYRCYEQVRNDICYQELPVVMAGIGCGLTYAPQGMTHYSVEDIGIARTMPNLTVISPADPIEARQAALYALDAQVPVYVRLAKRGEPTLHAQPHLDIARPQMLAEGEHIAVVCHGVIAEEALKAREQLAAIGIVPRVISVPMLQPLNKALLAEMLKGIDAVVSVEEHYFSSGLGAVLLELFSEYGLDMRLERLGLPSQFIHAIHTSAGMRSHFGIDAQGICERIKRLLGRPMGRTGALGIYPPAGCDSQETRALKATHEACR